MQNDLISRQAVIDLLQKNMSNDIQDKIITENNINLICSIQTAFNVEKVVEKLEKMKKVMESKEFYETAVGYRQAIQIVKRGIVSDDDVCEWKYNDEFEFAKSECGAIDTHRIAFRKLKFCPYCGKKIKVVN